MTISFRPHHFLCALCFQGRGYSPAFIANFQSIMSTLNAEKGDEAPINIVTHTDSICLPCPHRVEQTCLTETKISVLDRGHAQALGIAAGETITWGAAKQKISDNISMETFHRICATCSWKEYGICEGVLSKHNAE